MNNLPQIFNYNGVHGVRAITKNNEPWFVLRDVCEVIGLDSPHKVADRLDDDEKDRNPIPTHGGMQEMTIINESGLYNVILRSDKPEAKQFKKWITSDVLPSIRKHGMYAKDELLDNPDLLLDVVTKYKEERDRNRLLNTENKLLAQQQVQWADRRVIDALVKAYGSKIGFQQAWHEFKKELLYKHSINLNSRLTQKINDTGKKNFKTLDMIHDDEITACISTAVAMCRNNSIKIDAIINKFNIA